MAKGNVATVNALLKKAGRSERLVRGRGYFYLMHGEASSWHTSGIYGLGADAHITQFVSAVEYLFEQAGIKLKLGG